MSFVSFIVYFIGFRFKILHFTRHVIISRYSQIVKVKAICYNLSVMYLKSLEINGFKSFSQKTVLSFTPPKGEMQGITAIVGPNGSGKSNVADAIRWVLGEQSMKILRAKKSEDIIFAGSEAKGKMSMASVTMIIDNSDHKLPIDYDELVLTRRAYREGDNEYLVNGHPVRLIDLQLLLAKAQFGQGSYSVVGQGMIDRLLLQTPAERKDFFDEAFGIKEFQIKRHQAILKLARTKENMDQAEALLAEVTPRLKSLSRQVKKLEQRQEVEKELRELQEAYYVTLWDKNEKHLNELKVKLVEIGAAYKNSNDELTLVQMELAELAKESSREDLYNELQHSYQELVQQKNKLDKESSALAGRMQVEYSKAGKHNVGWLESKTVSLKQEQDKLQYQIDEAHKLLNSLREEQNKKKNEMDRLTVERVELRGRLSSLETKFVQAKSEQNFFQAAGLKAVQAILSQQNRFGRIYGALAQLGEVQQKYQIALDTAAGSHLSSIVVVNDNVAEECISFLRQEHLGVATFLPLNKIRPRILPHDIQEFLNVPGVHGLAVNLVKFSEKFNDIFSFVFGNTLVVENIEIARKIGIGRVRMVTLEGDMIETSGSMRGGYRRQKNIGLSFANHFAGNVNGSDVVDQSSQIVEMKNELDKVEKSYDETQKTLLVVKSQAEIENKKQEFLREQKHILNQELASLEQELSLQTMSKEEYSVALQEVAKNKEELDKAIVQLERDMAGVQTRIEDFHKEEERKKQRIFALQDAMQAAQAKLNKVISEKNDIEIVAAKVDTKQEDLMNEIYQELHSSIESIVRREGQSIELENIEAVQDQIQKLKYTLSLVGGIDEEVFEEYKETQARHDGLTSQLDDLKKAFNDLESLVVELDEMMKKRRDKSFKKIQVEFRRYFEMLFDGGKADLVEVMGDEVDKEAGEGVATENPPVEGVENAIEAIEAAAEGEQPKEKKKKKILQGMEIHACPPGKKIKDIQALSGGERTLTSIALICAILHVNPPPFCVLDEVEAALDEANTLRFNKILVELAKQSQFVLITHNRVTMHAADALYGVTMGGDGMSHLLSVKLGETVNSL